MPERVIQQNITCPEGSQVITRLVIAKHLSGMDHIRIFTEGLLEIALGDYTGQDFKVLSVILSGMEYENLYSKSQAAIAEKLGIQQQNVSKSLNKLIKGKWLKVIDKVGRQNVYMISPHLALKSRAKNHKGLLEVWEDI